MNCQEVKEFSSDYLDGRLAPAEVLLLEEHMNSCSACARELAQLRATISLMGSLGGIDTSPDFLLQVNRKIDGGRNPSRFWNWFVEPMRIKLPLEAAALLLVSTLALYLYQWSPELSQDNAVPIQRDFLVAKEEPREREAQPSDEAPMAKLLPAPESRAERKAPLSEIGAQAKAETQLPKSEAADVSGVAEKLAAAPVAGQAALDTETRLRRLEGAGRPEVKGRAAATAVEAERQASQSKRAEVTKAMSRGVAMSVPLPQVLDLVTEDVGGSQRRIKSVVEELGGKIVGERVSEDGLLLVLELPASRQADFQRALKKEPAREISAFWEPPEPGSEISSRAKGSVGDAPAALSQPKKSIQEKDEPTVKLEIRIRKKR